MKIKKYCILTTLIGLSISVSFAQNSDEYQYEWNPYLFADYFHLELSAEQEDLVRQLHSVNGMKENAKYLKGAKEFFPEDNSLIYELRRTLELRENDVKLDAEFPTFVYEKAIRFINKNQKKNSDHYSSAVTKIKKKQRQDRTSNTLNLILGVVSGNPYTQTMHTAIDPGELAMWDVEDVSYIYDDKYVYRIPTGTYSSNEFGEILSKLEFELKEKLKRAEEVEEYGSLFGKKWSELSGKIDSNLKIKYNALLQKRVFESMQVVKTDSSSDFVFRRKLTDPLYGDSTTIGVKFYGYTHSKVPFLETDYKKIQFNFSNGKPLVTGNLKERIRIGTWMVYNPDGSLQREVSYDNGIVIKDKIVNPFIYEYKYDDGSLMSRGPGLIAFPLYQKELAAYAYYQGSDQPMKFTILHLNVILESLKSFNRTGRWKYYKEDGFKYNETEFSHLTNNVKGKSIKFRRDGYKEILNYMSDGKTLTKYEFYNPDGRMIEEFKLDNSNQLSGSIFADNGIITSGSLLLQSKEDLGEGATAHFSTGIHADWRYVKDGKWKFYNENSNIYRQEDYKKGTLIKVTNLYQGDNREVQVLSAKGDWIFDEAFDINGSQTMKNGNGTIVNYHSNGKVSYKGKYVNGIRNGWAFWYHDNGVIDKSCEYNMGKRWTVGESNTPAGKELNSGTLLNGNGKWLQYDVDGNLTKSTNYKGGVKQE